MSGRGLRAGLMALLALAGAAAVAAEVPVPGPQWSPRQVVEIQLEALQHNDEPGPNAGIARAWQFAHPANRERTGPLARFSALLHSPPYRPLLDHRAHEVTALRIEPAVALFGVTITAASGRVLAYLWRVERISEGPLAGTWMTMSVSPPVVGGEPV